MNLPLSAILAATLVLAGCDARRDPLATDPLGNVQASEAVGRTMTCEARDANGNCLKNTCKADAAGDCATFAGYCVNAGEHWSGTKEGGSCTMVL